MSPVVVFLALQVNLKDTRKTIQARYDALDRGYRKRDIRLLENLLAGDFSTMSPEGKILGRAAALDSFRGLILGAQDARWPRKVLRLRFEGADTVATVDGRFTGGLPGPDGKFHPTELRSTVEDTWTLTSGAWRIRRSKMLKMAMWRDGKPVLIERNDRGESARR